MRKKTRYNFKATATDGTADAEFTFFTEAGEKITGSCCSDLRRKFIETEQLHLPKELTDAVGKKHIFQIQYASGSQKGTGRFIVKDVLDIPPKNQKQLPGTPKFYLLFQIVTPQLFIQISFV